MGRVVLFPWDGSWGWLLCQKGSRTTDKVGWPDFPLSPVGGKCPRRVVCQGMGPVSAPGASSRPGARTFLALPAFQSRRGWTFGISGFHGTCSGYGFISEAWWWQGISEDPFKHSFGNQTEFILPLLILHLFLGISTLVERQEERACRDHLSEPVHHGLMCLPNKAHLVWYPEVRALVAAHLAS